MDDGLGNECCFELIRFNGSVQRFGALPLSPMDGAVRGMTSWLPIRPKPQHWKSDESTELEETSAEEDQDWNDDSDADWTIDSEDHSSLSGRSACALVASDGQASLRRSISETDLLVSEEEVNQTFACWKEDLVGVTGLCGPVVDELLLANVRDHGWDTEQYLSEVLVAGFEESELKTSETYRKVFARARFALPCAAPHGVGDVCLVCREHVLATMSGRVATVSTVLVSQRGSAGFVWLLRTPSILRALRRVASRASAAGSKDGAAQSA